MTQKKYLNELGARWKAGLRHPCSLQHIGARTASAKIAIARIVEDDKKLLNPVRVILLTEPILEGTFVVDLCPRP